MNQPLQFRLPVGEYRSLPIPGTGSNGQETKLSTCFASVGELPEELRNWMSVNPRIPRFNKKEVLTGVVAKQIVRTLTEEPEKFALKNQGIYIIVDDVSWEKEPGGQGWVSLKLSDPSVHGIVNGGHTYRAIQQVKDDPDCPNPWDAYVQLHILKTDNADAAMIAEMAEGLNRSLQVDDPSLENLRGTFDYIKKSLDGKSGADQIAYRQGDSGDLDVRQVITYMCMLNLDYFPDRKTHPHTLFGQQKKVLELFTQDVTNSSKQTFKIIIPKLHEILVLIDKLQKESAPPLAKFKANNKKKKNRVGSKKTTAYFDGGTINGDVPLGHLYPMVASFRANVSLEAWKNGEFEWIVQPEDLLSATVDEMIEIIKQEHTDNNSKPADVGKKEAAYRGCYSVVTLELAQRGKLELTAN
jgi:hypothetical protein